jgi:hypothetical protein
MEPGSAPEWLPEQLTNNGLRVAADPPTPEEARAKAEAKAKPAAAVPLEHVERVVRERVAEIERRIESRLADAVADMKRALEHGGERRPAPDLLATLDGNGDKPAPGGRDETPVLEGAVDSRLREAERRVARAARATERNVDEVRRILGARLAASRWVSDPDNGSGR